MMEPKFSAPCPKCGGADVRRSRRFKPLDAPLSVAGRKPYRCRQCRTRFYLTDGAAVSESSRRYARAEKRKRSLRCGHTLTN